MDQFLQNLNIPSLSSDFKANLNVPISSEEISFAISALSSGKSPGPDGFPVELYKSFSSLLSPQLLSVLSDSFNYGKLPPSFNEASIILLLKKGKDPTECSSYRPISLLNVDVKILAKVLAYRLETVIPSIISDDQTGFIKNRLPFF